MRTRLRYQVSTDVPDGAGSSEKAWADSFALWAAVRPARADETVQGGPQVRARAEYEITCRFDARIEPGGRFRLEGTDRVLEIASTVDPDMRGATLAIRAHETLQPAS